MKWIRKHLTYTNAALTACAFLLAGGAAWAATATSAGTPGTIYACYAKHGGRLRVAGRCRHNERRLSWNIEGPRGLTGARGPRGHTGATGATGARGPSDLYAAGTAVKTLTGENTSYGQLVLPAGTYLVQAKATLFSKAANTQMICTLKAEPAPKAVLDGTVVTAEASQANVASLIGAQTFTGTETVELVCRLLSGEGNLDDAHLVATQVGALHGSLPVD